MTARVPAGRLRRGLPWALVLLAAAAAAPLAHPRVRAALRLTSAFEPLPGAPQVWTEIGGEALGQSLAAALDDAVSRVETGHGKPFIKPFRVYVCATEASFARRLALPADTPVRGLALWRDVWISPRAFHFAGRDTHAASLAHELSHLHLSQHLGLWRQRRFIPTWLAEGLADRVAGTGFEIVTPEAARQAIRAGLRIVPAAHGPGLLGHSGFGEGLAWPMGHAQARLFVEFLQQRDAAAFRRSMAALLAGETAGAALVAGYDRGLPALWTDFVATLTTRHGPEAAVPAAPLP